MLKNLNELLEISRKGYSFEEQWMQLLASPPLFKSLTLTNPLVDTILNGFQQRLDILTILQANRVGSSFIYHCGANILGLLENHASKLFPGLVELLHLYPTLNLKIPKKMKQFPFVKKRRQWEILFYETLKKNLAPYTGKIIEDRLFRPTYGRKEDGKIYILNGEKEATFFSLDSASKSIGQDSSNELSLKESKLAPRHAEILLARGKYYLENKAPYGKITYNNGNVVSSHSELPNGSLFRLEDTHFLMLRSELYRNNELDHFLDSEERLIKWPSKFKLRWYALHFLWSKYELNREYSELEFERVLRENIRDCDIALLRKEISERKFFERTPDGSVYRKRPVPPPKF